MGCDLFHKPSQEKIVFLSQKLHIYAGALFVAMLPFILQDAHAENEFRFNHLILSLEEQGETGSTFLIMEDVHTGKTEQRFVGGHDTLGGIRSSDVEAVSPDGRVVVISNRQTFRGVAIYFVRLDELTRPERMLVPGVPQGRSEQALRDYTVESADFVNNDILALTLMNGETRTVVVNSVGILRQHINEKIEEIKQLNEELKKLHTQVEERSSSQIQLLQLGTAGGKIQSKRLAIEWPDANDVSGYFVQVGTTKGGGEIANQFVARETLFALEDLRLVTQREIFVRIWSLRSADTWEKKDYVVSSESASACVAKE